MMELFSEIGNGFYVWHGGKYASEFCYIEYGRHVTWDYQKQGNLLKFQKTKFKKIK